MMFFTFPFLLLMGAAAVFLLLRFGVHFLSDFFRHLEGRDGEEDRLEDRHGWQRWNVPSLRERQPQNMEARIFRVAYKRKGRVTVSDIVLETGLGVKDAEELINGLVDGVHVRMEVDDRGLVVYEFPEIIARFEGD
jgi:hypothetical protein